MDLYVRNRRLILEYFFESSGSIVSGVGFAHFDALHIGWLIAFVIISAVVCFCYKKCGERGRRRFRFTVASLILLDEILKIVILNAVGLYTKNYLPLHLCSINIFLIVVHVFKPMKTLDNFLYAFCIPAAILALIFPTWTKLPFANFMHWHSFTVHILLCLYPLMLTVGGDIKPRVKYLWRALLLLVCMAVPVYIFNVIFDTNYMFLISAEKGNPLYLFEQIWGNHLLGIPVILVPLMAVVYLPWEVAGRKKKQSSDESFCDEPEVVGVK
jgi:hypothetical integral membrane protein (TIGR02206 family)